MLVAVLLVYVLSVPATAIIPTRTNWRVGGLSKWVLSRVISTLQGILIGITVLITQ